MKLPVALLGVFFLVAVGSVVASEESGGTGERVCPPEVDTDLPLFRKISELMKTCYHGLRGSADIMKGNDTSIGPIQTYFDEMCEQRVPNFIECMAEKTANLEVCKDPAMMIKLSNIMRDMFVNIIESGCAEGAKRFVSLVQGLKSIPNSGPNYENVKMCTRKRFAIMNAVHDTDSDVSSKLFVLHKEFTKFVDCLKMIECEPPVREVMDYFTNKVTNDMKCILPADGTIVPCTSLSKDSVPACCICGMKSHGSNMEMYDILENDAGKCFNNRITPEMQEKYTTDSEDLRGDIKKLCYSKGTATTCLKTPMFISEDCLNGTLTKEFKLLIDSINHGMEVACSEDGKRIADILLEVYRLKKSGQGSAVWDCVAVAKSTRNEIDEHRSSSKNMRFYHEMEAFKACLANKLQGHQTGVEAVTSLMTDLMGKVECASAEDGSAVHCETLMQHNHHHHH